MENRFFLSPTVTLGESEGIGQTGQLRRIIVVLLFLSVDQVSLASVLFRLFLPRAFPAFNATV